VYGAIRRTARDLATSGQIAFLYIDLVYCSRHPDSIGGPVQGFAGIAPDWHASNPEFSEKLPGSHGSLRHSKSIWGGLKLWQAFLPVFLKMKNDRGKIAAKSKNQAVFLRILLILINIARSDPVIHNG
jgi:hypothetical protein